MDSKLRQGRTGPASEEVLELPLSGQPMKMDNKTHPFRCFEQASKHS